MCNIYYNILSAHITILRKSKRVREKNFKSVVCYKTIKYVSENIIVDIFQNPDIKMINS